MNKIEYTIIKSRRKTLEVAIAQDAKVTVRVPYGISKETIDKFVMEKSTWIIKKQQEMNQRRLKEILRPKRNYTDGSLILFEGLEYPLYIATDEAKNTVSFEFCTQGLFVTLPFYDPSIMKQVMEGWYKNAAKIKLTERCAYFSRYVSKPYGIIRIKSQESCWGSCSSKRNLNFNWKLILMPPSVLDYVVVHELCHLEEMNHSKAFWSRVEAILPDYEVLRKWLKEHGQETEL